MDDRSKLIAFLGSTGHLDAQAARGVAEVFQPIALEKDAFLLREGQVSDTYLFLATGWLRAWALSPAGEEVTTGIFGPGNVAFEVDSFFNRVPSRENMVAIAYCSGWAITYAELNGLFHAAPAFREFGRAVLVRGYAALKGRMLAMVTETAHARYAALLSAQPAVLQHVPLKYIASYLGVTDSSLSRIRREHAQRHPA